MLPGPQLSPSSTPPSPAKEAAETPEPRGFEHVAQAQPKAVSWLKTALNSGRLHHAYAIVGAAQEDARRLAAALTARLLCTNLGSNHAACGQCAGCQDLASGTHGDAIDMEPNDKGSIPIDAVRAACARLGVHATRPNGYRVVRIHSADRMQPAAQHALLKTLEEPPERTVFLLTARRSRGLLSTIRSRCQWVRLAPPAALQPTRSDTSKEKDDLDSWFACLGHEADTAAQWRSDGADAVLQQLTTTLQAKPLVASNVLELAADLGTSKTHTAMALGFVEVMARHALAAASGATAATTTTASATLQQHLPAGIPPKAWLMVAKQLQMLRRREAWHPNRTMALEQILLALLPSAAPQSEHRL